MQTDPARGAGGRPPDFFVSRVDFVTFSFYGPHNLIGTIFGVHSGSLGRVQGFGGDSAGMNPAVRAVVRA